LKSRSLDSVARYFGIEIERRHRAGDDALATARVLSRLLELASERGAKTLSDLEGLGRSRARGRKRRKKRTAMPTPIQEI
jgi:DNA polymerase III epsilon subunit-like protein